jgi:hypothetical protein
MTKAHYAFLAVVLLIVGEIVTIYAELAAAKLPADASAALAGSLMPFVLIAFAGICLVLAYWMGYRVVGNIWVVTIASLTSILILEPIVVFVMFKELPSRGAVVGFILGALGFIAAITL